MWPGLWVCSLVLNQRRNKLLYLYDRRQQPNKLGPHLPTGTESWSYLPKCLHYKGQLSGPWGDGSDWWKCYISKRQRKDLQLQAFSRNCSKRRFRSLLITRFGLEQTKFSWQDWAFLGRHFRRSWGHPRVGNWAIRNYACVCSSFLGGGRGGGQNHLCWGADVFIE